MNIEHMALNVPDPAAMARWYCEHLGTRIVRSQAEPPFTHFVADEAGRGVLELYRHTRAAIPDYRQIDPLTLHIAFTTSDVASVRQRLLSAGATSAGDLVVTPAGDEMAFLHDPWGVTLQLVKRASPLLP